MLMKSRFVAVNVDDAGGWVAVVGAVGVCDLDKLGKFEPGLLNAP